MTDKDGGKKFKIISTYCYIMHLPLSETISWLCM